MKNSEHPKKIVLAYSGGLDTSVMLHWLKKTYGCELIAYCADIGQGEELSGLEEKALQTGASKLVVADLKDEFASEFVDFAIKANALYEGCYLMGTSLARPPIARRHVQIANEFGADAVAHGATGKGNDQVRFELTYAALGPDLKVVAPWRDWEFRGRQDLIDYARTHKIPVQATAEKPYSTDRNLMHISFEGGILENPWSEAPNDIFVLTQSPEKAPDRAEIIEVDFEAGCAIAIDGSKGSPAQILTRLNEIAGRHGVGRVDLVENRFVGIKSRGVYETPGVTALHWAHRALESICLDREVLHFKDSLNVKISEMIYNGFWFSPEGTLLRSTIEATQKFVSGTVKLKLYKGSVQVLGRKSPMSLYQSKLATFEAEDVYRQKDAEGFIRLQGLRLKVNATVRREGDTEIGRTQG